MRLKARRLLAAALFLLCPVFAINHARAQGTSQPEAARLEGVQHRVQLQFLVALNNPIGKTEYPAALEAVVKQIKASTAFKTHRLIATYVYNIADGGSFGVNDVTYTQFEGGSGLAPKFFSLDMSGVKAVPNSESVRIGRLKFDFRQRIFIAAGRGEGANAIPATFENVSTGISTEMSVREGVPTIVCTLNAGLDGVLVLILTVN